MNDQTGIKLNNLGQIIIRYGLVLILVWIGFLKFTNYESEGIKGLVANSFLISWGYDLMSVHAFGALIGVIEILLGIMIATRYFNPKLSAIGSMGTIIMAVITLTFILTTPPAWQKGFGFPFLSPMPGQFLLKDVLLLGAAVWTAGEALIASKQTKPIT